MADPTELAKAVKAIQSKRTEKLQSLARSFKNRQAVIELEFYRELQAALKKNEQTKTTTSVNVVEGWPAGVRTPPLPQQSQVLLSKATTSMSAVNEQAMDLDETYTPLDDSHDNEVVDLNNQVRTGNFPPIFAQPSPRLSGATAHYLPEFPQAYPPANSSASSSALPLSTPQQALPVTNSPASSALPLSARPQARLSTSSLAVSSALPLSARPQARPSVNPPASSSTLPLSARPQARPSVNSPASSPALSLSARTQAKKSTAPSSALPPARKRSPYVISPGKQYRWEDLPERLRGEQRFEGYQVLHEFEPENWVELGCKLCDDVLPPNTNVNGHFLLGIAGFKAHLYSGHKLKCPNPWGNDVPEHYISKRLSKEEIKQVRLGRYRVRRITQGEAIRGKFDRQDEARRQEEIREQELEGLQRQTVNPDSNVPFDILADMGPCDGQRIDG